MLQQVSIQNFHNSPKTTHDSFQISNFKNNETYKISPPPVFKGLAQSNTSVKPQAETMKTTTPLVFDENSQNVMPLLECVNLMKLELKEMGIDLKKGSMKFITYDQIQKMQMKFVRVMNKKQMSKALSIIFKDGVNNQNENVVEIVELLKNNNIFLKNGHLTMFAKIISKIFLINLDQKLDADYGNMFNSNSKKFLNNLVSKLLSSLSKCKKYFTFNIEEHKPTIYTKIVESGVNLNQEVYEDLIKLMLKDSNYDKFSNVLHKKIKIKKKALNLFQSYLQENEKINPKFLSLVQDDIKQNDYKNCKKALPSSVIHLNDVKSVIFVIEKNRLQKSIGEDVQEPLSKENNQPQKACKNIEYTSADDKNLQLTCYSPYDEYSRILKRCYVYYRANLLRKEKKILSDSDVQLLINNYKSFRLNESSKNSTINKETSITFNKFGKIVALYKNLMTLNKEYIHANTLEEIFKIEGITITSNSFKKLNRFTKKILPTLANAPKVMDSLVNKDDFFYKSPPLSEYLAQDIQYLSACKHIQLLKIQSNLLKNEKINAQLNVIEDFLAIFKFEDLLEKNLSNLINYIYDFNPLLANKNWFNRHTLSFGYQLTPIISQQIIHIINNNPKILDFILNNSSTSGSNLLNEITINSYELPQIPDWFYYTSIASQAERYGPKIATSMKELKIKIKKKNAYFSKKEIDLIRKELKKNKCKITKCSLEKLLYLFQIGVLEPDGNLAKEAVTLLYDDQYINNQSYSYQESFNDQQWFPEKDNRSSISTYGSENQLICSISTECSVDFYPDDSLEKIFSYPMDGVVYSDNESDDLFLLEKIEKKRGIFKNIIQLVQVETSGSYEERIPKTLKDILDDPEVILNQQIKPQQLEKLKTF